MASLDAGIRLETTVGVAKVGFLSGGPLKPLPITIAGDITHLAPAFACSRSARPSPTTQCSCTGVGVDTAGNVYVTDSDNNRVLKLAAGSSSQTELPFTGLSGPSGVAVDGAGNVYVSDENNDRVVKLPAH